MTTIRDYDDLIAALRSRQNEIGIKDEDLEMLTGLTRGHIGKLFGPTRVKNLGAHSIFLLTGALALRWVIEPDLEAAQRMERRWEKRDELRRREGVIRKRFSPEIKAHVVSEAARERVNVLNASMLPENRSERARRAAHARWKRTTKRERRQHAQTLVAARREKRKQSAKPADGARVHRV